MLMKTYSIRSFHHKTTLTLTFKVLVSMKSLSIKSFNRENTITFPFKVVILMKFIIKRFFIVRPTEIHLLKLWLKKKIYLDRQKTSIVYVPFPSKEHIMQCLLLSFTYVSFFVTFGLKLTYFSVFTHDSCELSPTVTHFWLWAHTTIFARICTNSWNIWIFDIDVFLNYLIC